MTREAVDIWGDHWTVVEARSTRHGFDVLLGRPTIRRRGGATVICTRVLADHMIKHAIKPSAVDLPVGDMALKRLRRLLDLGRQEVRAQFWLDRSDDLRNLTVGDFAAKHGCSVGAVATARIKIHGRTLKTANWHLDPGPLKILLSDHPTALIADAWGIPASTVRRLRWQVKGRRSDDADPV